MAAYRDPPGARTLSQGGRRGLVEGADKGRLD